MNFQQFSGIKKIDPNTPYSYNKISKITDSMNQNLAYLLSMPSVFSIPKTII